MGLFLMGRINIYLTPIEYLFKKYFIGFHNKYFMGPIKNVLKYINKKYL